MTTPPPAIAGMNFFTAEAWDDATLLPKLRWLQEHDPVHWSEVNQLWVLTRYADVYFVSKNHRLFCSGEGVRPGNLIKIGLIDEDEPRHTQLRRLLNRGFTPRMVSKLEPAFRQIATEAIDAVAAQGQCDFVESISVPLPLLLIAEMIGIRREDRGRFHQWSDHMIAGDGNRDNPEIMGKAIQAFMEYTTYVAEIIEDRRTNPRDDLVSVLVGAKDAGILGKAEVPDAVRGTHDEEHAEVSSDELLKMMVLLLVAGNETTRNGISGGMQLLIEHPDARDALARNPARIPAAVEEMLRLTTPVRSFSRTATEDTELRGRSIKKGQQVLMIYTAANRDPGQFADPERFDIDRQPEHLAFGIGNHFCLGANLARLEMRIAFEEILRRLPDIHYAGSGPVFEPSPLVRTCKEMQVAFTPEVIAQSA